MADVYDMPPAGFVRAYRGWLVRPPTSGDRRLAKLEKENQELRQMLQQIIGRFDDNSHDILNPR
jgi:hypothetical protein